MSKSQNGFTLIEVLVVLSLLALIAILAYNLFGNTMKDASYTAAATQIHKELTSLDAAMDEWSRINDGEAYGAVIPADKILLQDGVIKASPIFPEAAKNSTPPWEYRYQGIGFGYKTAANDLTIRAINVNDATCRKFNELFTPWGNYLPLSGELSTATPPHMPVCVNHASADVNTIYFVREWY